MSARIFTFLIVISTVISFFSWLITLSRFDPEKIAFLGFLIFYFSLFLWLSGLIFLFTNFLKKIFFKKQLLYYRVRNSVRHAIFFSILILIWAFLKSQNLFRWWNILTLIIILTLLEFFFISCQKQQGQSYGPEDQTT